jgi:excisionase family DNA binding protein
MNPKQNKAEIPVLLDPSALAAHLGTTERHIRRLVSERRIPYVKVGRFVRFEPAAVTEWLDRWTVEARP